MYNLAKELTELQLKNNFLENYFRTLIEVYSGTSEDKLPPVTDLEVKIGKGVIWIKYEVEQRLREIMASTVPLIKAYPTANFKFAVPQEEDKYLFNAVNNRAGVLELSGTYSLTSAEFMTLDLNPYFDL